MNPTLGRLLTIRRRAALTIALLSVPAYLIAWNVDPWAWGVLVLGLWPLQTGLALLGIAARVTRREPSNVLVPWIVDLALIAMAVGSLAFARTIDWA